MTRVLTTPIFVCVLFFFTTCSTDRTSNNAQSNSSGTSSGSGAQPYTGRIRVSFPPGQEKVTYTMLSSGSDEYVFSAKDNQILVVKFRKEDPLATWRLTDANTGQPVKNVPKFMGGQLNFPIGEDGDKMITVKSEPNKQHTLEIELSAR